MLNTTLFSTSGPQNATLRAVANLATLSCAIILAVLTWSQITVPDFLPNNDKLYHMLAFAGLILPSAMLHPRALVWVLLGSVLFGGLIEIVQPSVGRNGEWLDFYADILGLGLGVIVGLSTRAAYLAYLQNRKMA